jgi:hypothetical protein
MQTVVETPTYIAEADKAGVTDDERAAIIDYIAANPQAGEVISGGGGVRKVRIAREGKGKSGGYRIITYYMDENTPVFLVTMLSKSKQENLTDAQKKAAKSAAKSIKKGE